MKKNLYLISLLCVLQIQAQDLELPFKFGEVHQRYFNMAFYPKDSSANAVVLYEKGLAKVVIVNDYLKLQTTYYYKIKIFNKSGNKYATVEIPLYYNLK